MPATRPQTIPARLQARLAQHPAATALYLVASDSSTLNISFEELMRRAISFGACFGSPAKGGRQTIAICLYHGLDLHAAFLGAIWAGHIPTMIAPPSPRMEAGKYSRSFCQMLEHLRPSMAVADPAVISALSRLDIARFPQVRIVNPEDVSQNLEAPAWSPHPEDIALIQHSSGTTGLQKGIALSHQAILRHNRSYSQCLGLMESDVVASWLPLYHDMGLIACFLLPLLEGIPVVEISPFDWVSRPQLLLENIHQHRATLCWLPNFAYSFMAQSIARDQLPRGLDLSHLRAWINCSEPVRPSSHAEFLAAFSSVGVRADQLTACYGMAENVYAVTQSIPGSPRVLHLEELSARQKKIAIPAAEGPGARPFFSNGRPIPGTQVRVADEDGRPLPDGHFGELLLQGEHLFSGYFQREDLTRLAMTQDGWYKTGDIGFLHGGEVYITGRKKDLIIIQGRNFDPTDIESAVSQVEGIVAGRVVAFGIPDSESGTERLIILAEADCANPSERSSIALSIRKQVAQQLDCTPSEVHLLPRRWLIKSTSGKLARQDNREKYLREIVAHRKATRA